MKDYVIYAVLGISIILLVFTLVNFIGVNAEKDMLNYKEKNIETTSEYETKSSGSTSMGAVSIDLTPRKENNKLVVEISANTHSVNLGQFDLAEITVLEYNEQVVKPVSAPRLSGHHSSGELVFNVNPEKFTIKITGIPSVQERIFEWR